MATTTLMLHVSVLWLANAADSLARCPEHCQGNSVQDIYCTTRISAKVRILNERPYTAAFDSYPDYPDVKDRMQRYRYDVEIINVYKGGNIPSVIESEVSPELCGLRYEHGRTYLIMTKLTYTGLREYGMQPVLYGTNCKSLNIDVEAEPEEFEAAMEIIKSPFC